MAKNEKIFFTKEGFLVNETVQSGVQFPLGNSSPDGLKFISMYFDTDPSAVVTGVSLRYSTDGGSTFTDCFLINGDQLTLRQNVLDEYPFPKDKNGNKFINLPAGSQLAFYATSSNASAIKIYAYYENY